MRCWTRRSTSRPAPGRPWPPTPTLSSPPNPQLSTLVFRYRPVLADGTRLDEHAADALNPAIRAAVFASGEAVVAGTKVAGRHYLKFTLLNAEATPEDIDADHRPAPPHRRSAADRAGGRRMSAANSDTSSFNAPSSTSDSNASGAGHIYDFAGIGVGPFNLGLAALTEPVDELDAVFLERRDSFDWHPGMMLEPAHLQVPFMADLVTLADPTSPYSFLNFLKQTGRLYRFYIRENFYPLRAEYNQYCQWVAGQLDSVHFGTDVRDITYDGGVYTLSVDGPTGPEVLRTRRLVLGTGTSPYVPAACDGIVEAAANGGGLVLHNADYLSRKVSCRSNGASPSWAAGRARRRSTTSCCRKSTSTATS